MEKGPHDGRGDENLRNGHKGSLETGVASYTARLAVCVPKTGRPRVSWSGEFENQQRAMKRLAFIVPVSVLLMFILPFDAFKSVKITLLVLLNVPFRGYCCSSLRGNACQFMVPVGG